jgi:hypothetical protein
VQYRIAELVLASKLSCKRENKTKEAYVGHPNTETGVHLDRYPESLKKVFEAHGGLLHWKRKNSLAFKHGEERHPMDLQTRMYRVDVPAYSLGFDGDKVWLHNQR